MIKKLLIFSFFTTGFYLATFAQNAGIFLLENLADTTLSNRGSVIYLDEGIEENYYLHLAYNSKAGKALGYRIRIYS